MKRSIGYRIILNGEKWWGIKWLCMMTIEGGRGFVAVIGGGSGEGAKGLRRFAKEITWTNKGDSSGLEG